MTDVQQIIAAVGENNFFTFLLVSGDDRKQFVYVFYFGYHRGNYNQKKKEMSNFKLINRW
jgi:hypothetical protein